jgi:hypothetical protein
VALALSGVNENRPPKKPRPISRKAAALQRYHRETKAPLSPEELADMDPHDVDMLTTEQEYDRETGAPLY